MRCCRTWNPLTRSCLMLVLVLGCTALAGCQERVVRQRSYYSGQFSDVTRAKPATAAPREVEQTDFLQDAWAGLGDLFRRDRGDSPPRNIMTVEELRAAQEKRSREQRGSNQAPRTDPANESNNP